MNIKTTTLKQFKNLASNLKGSNIIPIHGYLKFGNGEICKNVNSSFIKYSVSESDEELLVSEHDLYSLLAVTSASFISITKKKDGKVELNDGKDKIVIQSPKIKEFSDPPESLSQPVKVSEDFMDAVMQASNFANFIKDMPTYYGYVHIGHGTVCAGDGIIAFHCPVEEKIQMVIEGTTAKFIAKQDVQSFSVSDNFYFLSTPEATIGLVMPIIGWFDIRSIFENKRTFAFTLDTSDVMSFNALSLQLCPDPLVTITDGKFEMNDMLLDKYHERAAENMKIQVPFSYNPARMNTVLLGLGGEEMDFHEAAPCYFLTNKDTKATAIIAKINKA